MQGKDCASYKVYSNAWESFRDHSIRLNNSRYGHLTSHSDQDYEKWAKGLKKAGYATDPHYSKKLINLIEKYKLYILDRIE